MTDTPISVDFSFDQINARRDELIKLLEEGKIKEFQREVLEILSSSVIGKESQE
jgi:hypothetical protein